MSVIPWTKVYLDKERHMNLSLNAMIKFRDATGNDILRGFDSTNASIEDQRALIWACLVDEDPELTQEQVGELVTIQNYLTLSEALATAISVSMPETKASPKAARRSPG